MNEVRFPQVGDSIFFCLPRLYLYFAENSLLGPVHMIPDSSLPRGNSLTPGSTLPRCMHGLTSVTVHMNFSWPWGNFERLVTRCTAGLAKVTFLHVNRMQKLSPGKSSLAHAHYQCLE